MSFRRSRRASLSGVTADRSQVEAEMTVVRPKGDLLFTLDTYLTADRRTNVQLSWRQLENEGFPLVAGELNALPQDLQRIGVLVARGTYTPPSDGGTNSDSPFPLDPTLAAEIQAERDALLPGSSMLAGRSDRMDGLRRSASPDSCRSTTTSRRSSVRKTLRRVTPTRFPG